MSDKEHSDFGRILAFQSAPSMLGIKPANLINIDKNKFSVEDNIRLFNTRAGAKGIRIYLLKEYKSRKLLLVYNEKLLRAQLARPDVQRCFAKFGYSKLTTLGEYLMRLSKRLNENGDFPHEIGLFLGYPVKDVLRIRARISCFAAAGRFTPTRAERKNSLIITISAEHICAIN